MNEFALYSYFRSSASFRVRIAMKLKKLTYDYHAVHLLKNGGEQFQSKYGELNPSREVPTLIHKGKNIAQSMAIIDYLDHVQPTPRLFPEEPLKRALVIQGSEIINSGTQPLVNTRITKYLTEKLGVSDDAKNQWVKFHLEHGSHVLEDFLKPHAGSFAFGNAVTATDCFIFPHMFSCDRFGASYADCPTLMRLKETYMKGDAFLEAMPNKQPDFEG